MAARKRAAEEKHSPPLRVLTDYSASCTKCGVRPASPTSARVHAASENHVIVEVKKYVVAMREMLE